MATVFHSPSSVPEHSLFAVGMAESAYKVAITSSPQIGGPALGFWQMEPATAKDILDWLSVRHPRLRAEVHNLTHGETPRHALEFNSHYSCALTRCFFLRIGRTVT